MLGEDAITHDTLLRGRVHLLQPRRGYRSSLDPVLLAAFIEAPLGHFLDLGCGTGALSFLLLAKDAQATGVGCEIQAHLADLALRGRDTNHFQGRFDVARADARETGALPARAFDLVATNPPFRPRGSGNLPPSHEKAMANHEVTLTLAGWLDVATAALRPDGRIAVIFPYDRERELRASLGERGYCVRRSRRVLPAADQVPKRILVEARAGSGHEETLPALIVHRDRRYTDEVRRMLGEES